MGFSACFPVMNPFFHYPPQTYTRHTSSYFAVVDIGGWKERAFGKESRQPYLRVVGMTRRLGTPSGRSVCASCHGSKTRSATCLSSHCRATLGGRPCPCRRLPLPSCHPPSSAGRQRRTCPPMHTRRPRRISLSSKSPREQRRARVLPAVYPQCRWRGQSGCGMTRTRPPQTPAPLPRVLNVSRLPAKPLFSRRHRSPCGSQSLR